jgi:hypothetical protein
MKTWGIFAAIALGAYVFATISEADRDSAGAIVDEGRIDAFQIRVGDCFNDTSTMSSDEEVEILNVPGVPCSEPHDNEVYAVFDLSITNFPAGDAMADLAFNSCLERFEPFVGKGYASSSLDILPIYPTLDSWKQRNDREVIRGVFDMNLAKLQGSVQGSGL